MGLQVFSVEKDFWVCWILRELFALSDIGEHLTFKGGTSLSKAWNLIQRFSEDIDLVVDKEALGFGKDASPESAASKKQQRKRLDSLRAASQKWVQGALLSALSARITDILGESGWNLEVDPDTEDGQCLLFEYPSVLAKGIAGYINPVVKIELGARSDIEPHENRMIRPYVLEQFPALDTGGTFSVRVISTERTFW
ncbi:MAG: nucleotidyl transferase AbiEii/AbiGii toxin family protein, partial [Candidatus Cloacimonetes bacterium]|nr:nucleotidyl transferase AbiEii/AbiGii toxin family protein [Candidatus Cloacimonadota bacterium]